MKQWVCIDNKGYEQELVQGKTYTEIASGYLAFCILIKNEMGIVTEYYQPLRFLPIDEWRQMQLKKIGI